MVDDGHMFAFVFDGNSFTDETGFLGLLWFVFQEMLQLGVVAKLCLVRQVDSNTKTIDKARELLKLHARAWKNSSSCVPLKLLASYPAA
ncbi:hypothetical protein Q3G72_004109 [Acer saccharum]|nr:hypothetical protein Q3G72_004109 [Acer saccharum]